MGSFFSSPKEEMAGSLADLAMNGKLPKGWENKIDSSSAIAKTNIESNASRNMATSAVDTLSQAASSGVGPGTAVTSMIGKNNAQIAERTGGALAEVDIAALQQKIGSLGQLLGLGMGNMKDSTGFGDLLAGLSTVTNIAGGVVGAGGSQGLGLWGTKKPTTTGTTNMNLRPVQPLPGGKKDGFDWSKTKAEPTILDWTNR